MAADQEPTAWELMRILQTVQETLGRMEGRMVTQDSLKTYQESNERRLAAIEAAQTGWTVESRGEHTRLDGKINNLNESIRAQLDGYREKQEALERQARDQQLANVAAEKKDRAARIFQVSMAVLAIVGSLAVGVILQQMGAAP